MPRVACDLFITDLDGTILVDEGEKGCHLPAPTLQALRRLHASGVKVCLASGRMHESMAVIAQSLGFPAHIISYNGAMVRGEDGSLIHHEPLDVEVSDEVVSYAESHDLPLNFYQEGRILSRRFHPWWDLYEGRTCSPMTEVQSLSPYRGSQATKLLVMSEPSRIRALRDHFRPRFAGKATVLITADEYLEFFSPTVNKGVALRRLAQRLGVDLGQVVAAGDGHNDLEMLQAAGTAVAIETGRDELKGMAHHVVAPPERGGVAGFIESFLLD
jgi:hypothetical protein